VHFTRIFPHFFLFVVFFSSRRSTSIPFNPNRWLPYKINFFGPFHIAAKMKNSMLPTWIIIVNWFFSSNSKIRCLTSSTLKVVWITSLPRL
jgi:hypothetical protein